MNVLKELSLVNSNDIPVCNVKNQVAYVRHRDGGRLMAVVRANMAGWISDSVSQMVHHEHSSTNVSLSVGHSNDMTTFTRKHGTNYNVEGHLYVSLKKNAGKYGCSNCNHDSNEYVEPKTLLNWQKRLQFILCNVANVVLVNSDFK